MHVYATSFWDDAVSWFERDATTGALSFGGFLKDGENGVDGLNAARSLLLSKDGKFAYVAGTWDNSISWFERNATTGALSFGGFLKDGENGVDGQVLHAESPFQTMKTFFM